MPCVFADAQLDEEFGRRGYVVCPLLAPHEIESLLQLHQALPPDQPADFYATVFSRDVDYRRRVSEGVGAALMPRLQSLLPEHELCFAVFVTKRAMSSSGRVPLHRDYWFADPRVDRAVHVWCPLVDVDQTNSCLQVVPGSHTLVDSPYAVNEYPPVFDRVKDVLHRKFLTDMPMTAGSALLYDSRLFHASGENRSGAVRPACVAILLPRGVPPRVYVWNGSTPTRFDVLEVSKDFLLRMERGAPVREPYPADVRHVDTVDFPVEPLSARDLEALLPRERGRLSAMRHRLLRGRFFPRSPLRGRPDHG